MTKPWRSTIPTQFEKASNLRDSEYDSDSESNKENASLQKGMTFVMLMSISGRKQLGLNLEELLVLLYELCSRTSVYINHFCRLIVGYRMFNINHL